METFFFHSFIVLQTVTVVQDFILAMMEHPEVLRKAQEEIDRVVGPGRLPTFSDRPQLPYVDCVMSEVLRWGVPVPLGMFGSVSYAEEFSPRRRATLILTSLVAKVFRIDSWKMMSITACIFLKEPWYVFFQGFSIAGYRKANAPLFESYLCRCLLMSGSCRFQFGEEWSKGY